MKWFLALKRRWAERGKRVQVQSDANARWQLFGVLRAEARKLGVEEPDLRRAMASERRSVPTPVDELSTLLDKHANARAALPDLAYIEAALQLSADTGLSLVAEPVLQRAIAQLRSIADLNKSPRLALLDLQMRRQAGAAIARRHASAMGIAGMVFAKKAEPAVKPLTERPQIDFEDTAARAPRNFLDTVIEEGPHGSKEVEHE